MTRYNSAQNRAQQNKIMRLEREPDLERFERQASNLNNIQKIKNQNLNEREAEM